MPGNCWTNGRHKQLHNFHQMKGVTHLDMQQPKADQAKEDYSEAIHEN